MRMTFLKEKIKKPRPPIHQSPPFEELQTLRGMKDQSYQDCFHQKKITQICSNICQRFHYQEIQTPLLENISVFSKTLGADVVSKELYQFKDKSGQTVALRPEGTAGAVRFFNNKKFQNKRQRFFYSGPMFRHERPQKGRLRQFHQFGVESFGDSSALAELELIQMAQMVLKELKILPQTKLIINSLGDAESRRAYKKKLLQYLEPLQTKLSPESQVRLKQNPLRILDSKSQKDQEVLKQAPRPIDFLNSDSKKLYQEVLLLLKENQIPFVQDDFLVRGLDYYSHTVFEWTSPHLGAQSAVLAGGRYDSLTAVMGGESCPAAGWACGIERIALLCPITEEKTLLIGIAADPDLKSQALQKAQFLRENRFSVYMPELSSFSNQMKKINKQGCSYALILGKKEWGQKQAGLKDMNTGRQNNIPINSIEKHLKTLL